MLLTGNVSIEPWCTRAAVGLPVGPTTRVVEMMPWWRRWGWSVRHQKRTVHIIFGNTSFFIGATSALCSTKNMLQSINQYLYCKLTIVNHHILYCKNRAPKFYAGLLQILCWEPGGLPSFKVSGDPWSLHSAVAPHTLQHTSNNTWNIQRMKL